MLPTTDQQSPALWATIVTPEAVDIEQVRRDASDIAGALEDRPMTSGELHDRVGFDADRARLAKPNAIAVLGGRIAIAIRSGDIEEAERWTGVAERLLRRTDGLCLAEDIGLV